MYTDEKQPKSREEHEINRATAAAKTLEIEYLALVIFNLQYL